MMKCLLGWTLSGILFFSANLSAQQLKPDWQNLDLKKDSVFGISLDKAYAELLKGKPAVTVTVAVIDGGLDVKQEDLQGVIWTNPREIPGNGKDDDGNGYVDDIHGWNFLGSSHDDYEYDNERLVTEVREGRQRFGGRDSLSLTPAELPAYRLYRDKEKELADKFHKVSLALANYNRFMQDVEQVRKKIGKEDPTIADLRNFIPSGPAEEKVQRILLQQLQRGDFRSYVEFNLQEMEHQRIDSAYHLNIDYDPRGRYAADYALSKGWFYGNPHIGGPVPPLHGTHVAGIIGALRNNGIGINGVADHVLIMPLRAVPDGGGRDWDEAAAIRYAADNGARVINMSFGLSIANDRQAVEAAVDYAMAKDILFIQAAGNGGENVDGSVYPARSGKDPKNAISYFIKVGASGPKDDAQLMLPFSNYGKTGVDVFAPGLGINSTLPGNHYEQHSGTSMAAPVVAGLAAVIREYYPRLTAPQVKEIIMRSVVPAEALREKCVSGGVVNAYQALKLAATY